MKLHQIGTPYHLRTRIPTDRISVMGRREVRTSDGNKERSRVHQLKAVMPSGSERLYMDRLSVTREDELVELANGTGRSQKPHCRVVIRMGALKKPDLKKQQINDRQVMGLLHSRAPLERISSGALENTIWLKPYSGL